MPHNLPVSFTSQIKWIKPKSSYTIRFNCLHFLESRLWKTSRRFRYDLVIFTIKNFCFLHRFIFVLGGRARNIKQKQGCCEKLVHAWITHAVALPLLASQRDHVGYKTDPKRLWKVFLRHNKKNPQTCISWSWSVSCVIKFFTRRRSN